MLQFGRLRCAKTGRQRGLSRSSRSSMTCANPSARMAAVVFSGFCATSDAALPATLATLWAKPTCRSERWHGIGDAAAHLTSPRLAWPGLASRPSCLRHLRRQPGRTTRFARGRQSATKPAVGACEGTTAGQRRRRYFTDRVAVVGWRTADGGAKPYGQPERQKKSCRSRTFGPTGQVSVKRGDGKSRGHRAPDPPGPASRVQARCCRHLRRRRPFRRPVSRSTPGYC